MSFKGTASFFVMDIEERMAQLEQKIDDLRDEVRGYHEELLRNYYTKNEVDQKTRPVPQLQLDVALLKESVVLKQSELREAIVESVRGVVKTPAWEKYVLIILWLVAILATVLGVKLPGV